MEDRRLPERIAILFGIPITREEFVEKAGDPLYDYARRLMVGRSVDEAFTIYEPLVCVARELIACARAYGVSVYPSARLRDLLDATQRHDVVVIIAHWRGSAIAEADLLDGWGASLSRCAPGTPLAIVTDLIRNAHGHIDFEGGTDSPSRRALVVNALNRAIESGKLLPFLPHQIGTKIDTHELILQTLSRDVLDEEMGSALRRGNQLELADGLHSPADIEDAIDADFAGHIDLSCCTAAVLGTYLKLMRGNRLRVLMGDHLVIPAPQLRVVQKTLELLAINPNARYAETRVALSRGLTEQTFAHS